MADPAFTFGPFHLVPAQRALLQDGRRVRLGSRSLELLIVLVQRAGEVVANKDLVALVWPNLHVEEGSLRVHIAALRRSLGDGRAGLRYIMNVPSRGYSFVAPVSRDDAQPSASETTEERIDGSTPLSLTSIIGRADIISTLTDEMQKRRFLSIVGPGGIGKTTVARAIAEVMAPVYPDGVWFVALSGLSDFRHVPGATISALRHAPFGSTDLPSLVANLRDKRILIVLDNCEHVLDGAAELAETLLNAGPGVHIAATSREPLRADGEWVQRLPSLAVPPTVGALSAAEALTFPAVQLFTERAMASMDEFVLENADVATVVEICRRLDGIPLAIELAAVRAAALGVRQVAAHLDDRFALLTRGRRTAMPRHQTLRATLDWSYDLLSETEAAILRRLAVFTGDFSLDAAIVVAGDLAAPVVVDYIANLVAKSLIAADLSGEDARYRLLDTTRLYALEKLHTDGEHPEAARRHAEYYRTLLADAKAESEAMPQAEWLKRSPHFAAVDNVRAALGWCFSASGNSEIGVGLAAAAAPVFLAMSLLPECHRWSEQAISALDDTTRGGFEEMHLQAGLGISSMYITGSSEQSYAALTRGLELADEFHDPVNQFRLINQLHGFHRRAGNFDRMLAVARRSEVIANEMADPLAWMAAQSLLGLSHHLIGNQAEARAHSEAALAPATASNSARARRFSFQYERAQIVLARTLWLQGYPEQAVQLARKTVDGFATFQPVTIPIATLWGGCTFRWSGDLATAKECIDCLIWHAERHALTPYQAIGYGLKGQMLIQQGEIEPGMELLRGSLATLSAERYELYATELKGAMAQGLAIMGRLDQALLTIDQTIAQLERHGELFVPELQRIRGEILEKTADERGAEEAFHRSIELADQQSALSWRLRASMSFARLRSRQGRREEAREALAETYARFSEGFETADLKAAKRLLATLR